MVAFSNYIGNEDLVAKAKKAVQAYDIGVLSEIADITLASSYLLYGPPGVGKTLFARELFKYIQENSSFNWKIFYLRPNELLSQYVNESGKNIAAFYADIRKFLNEDRDNNRAFIFADEYEAIAAKRGGSGTVAADHDKAISLLLQEVDGLLDITDINGPKFKDYCFAVYATNHKDKIDPALIRPGRVDEHWEIKYIDQLDDTMKLFNVMLSNRGLNLEIRPEFLAAIGSILTLTNQVTPAFVDGVVMGSVKESVYDYHAFKDKTLIKGLKTDLQKSLAKQELQVFYDESHLLESFIVRFKPFVQSLDIPQTTKDSLIENIMEIVAIADPRKDSILPNVLGNYDPKDEPPPAPVVANLSIDAPKDQSSSSNSSWSSTSTSQKYVKDEAYYKALRDFIAK
jgi:AAA+ superfamily predicted ATPase